MILLDLKKLWLYLTLIALFATVTIYNPDLFADDGYVGAYRSQIGELISQVRFLSESPSEIVKFNNGLWMSFNYPIIGFRTASEKKYKSYGFLYRNRDYFQYVTVLGINVSFKNNSRKAMVIRWRESTLSSTYYSAMPFLDNMYYVDANTNATPDTIIAPEQVVTKDLYISKVYPDNWADSVLKSDGKDSYNSHIQGECIPIGGSVKFNLLMKIYDPNGNGDYYNIHSPGVGLPCD